MAGVIVNNSKQSIWITANNQKYCLNPGETSSEVQIDDADGLLLDGRPVLFDSSRTGLGGGEIHKNGALKVCDPGKMTVSDGLAPAYVLKVEISVAGFVCPGDPAGYKDPKWCSEHPGWDINTAPLVRPCK